MKEWYSKEFIKYLEDQGFEQVDGHELGTNDDGFFDFMFEYPDESVLGISLDFIGPDEIDGYILTFQSNDGDYNDEYFYSEESLRAYLEEE